jgi:hypothetical protein
MQTANIRARMTKIQRGTEANWVADSATYGRGRQERPPIVAHQPPVPSL